MLQSGHVLKTAEVERTRSDVAHIYMVNLNVLQRLTLCNTISNGFQRILQWDVQTDSFAKRKER